LPVADRLVGVERGRDDVDDREQGDDGRHDPDHVAPPRPAEEAARAPPALDHLGVHERGRLAMLDCRHARFSRDFVRQNPSAEIDATMKKMRIEIALASAKSWPLPDSIASLYV
jgi:hypothetical protein